MAKRKPVRRSSAKPFDLKSWNFILFLTLSFILLVVVLSALQSVSFDLRTRAAGSCPALTAPRPEDCPGGWTFKRDMNGCQAFFCDAKPPQPEY